MSDDISILTSANHTSLVKTFSGPDLKKQSFAIGKEFNVTEEPVSNLQNLSKVLHKLENDPTRTIIRGSLIEGKTNPVPRNKTTFTATLRQWCMIDIDSLAWDGDINDQQAMLSYAIEQLPIEFQSVDCWYHFSSSMGIKAGIRVHLWFWLERPCSDDEMKAWLSGCPVDLRLFNPIQIHLTANPRFIAGAIDPYPNRSGLFEAGNGVSIVPVPANLASRTAVTQAASRQRSSDKSGLLDPADITRDPDTGLAINGREQLMFLLSNEVMRELVTAKHTPSEEEVTTVLWSRFCEEADISIVSERGAWTIADAASKAKARLQELERGAYDFVSRSDRTTLVAGTGKAERPKLVGTIQAQLELNNILDKFFGDLTEGSKPRAAIRLTMGAGKTKKTITHLKAYLEGKYRQKIEVYVPRHDLADEWTKSLEGINANVIHVYPRTGGEWDNEARAYKHPIMCQRADYVRDLEEKGHSIYGNACLSRTSREQCSFLSSCAYLDQFRQTSSDIGVENTIRIYTHASLFLSRNEFERQTEPDLVIIDEAFLSSAVSNMPSIPVGEVTQHVRVNGIPNLGFDLLECLTEHQGDLSYLRAKDIGAFEFNAVSIEGLNPATPFSADTAQSRNVRSAKQYKALTKLLEIAAREIEDQGRDSFGQLAYNRRKNEIVICEHKPTRVPRTTPVLYLDATADSIITEAYLPALQHHQIDVRQLAVVSQVYDRTGSNSFWNNRIGQEQQNLSDPSYDPQHNDIAALITILNEWVKAGESPLLVAHKDLCDQLRVHPKLDEGVAVAHFMSLRGSNAYEDKSVIFITGRNQPPLDDIERQARAIFGNSGNPLGYDDLENLPSDQVEYWLSKRSPHTASAITIPAFSDPRIEAVQKQIREAETVQAIARLRLVWAEYQKRVFLLSNLPVEMPVDHLIEFNDLMPDRLEMELIKKGDIPLTTLGLEKMRPDLELSKEAIKKLVQRSKASNPKRLLTQLPDLVRTATQIATFKAGDKRKTTHQHLFLPKDYSGSPTTSIYTPWTDEEAEAYLTAGWGEGAITEFNLKYLYGPEPEVSGE
ncbi:hypothetical protein GN241_14505 [Rhodobacteraceae bacterium IMCC1335]